MTSQVKKSAWSIKAEEHEHTIKNIKIIIISVMLVLACLFRYNGFVRYHGDLFGLEIATYVGCSIAAYIFLNLVRRQDLLTFDFLNGLIVMVIFTVVVVACAEYSGLNTKFVLEEEEAHDNLLTKTPFPLSRYRREAIEFKQKMLENMVITVNVLFLGILLGWYMRSTQEGLERIPIVIFFVGVIIALISSTALQIKGLRKYMIENHYMARDSNLSNSQLGLTIYFAVVFGIFTIIILLTSLFRYDSLKIYSYFPDNPKMCGMKRKVATVLLFIVETLMVAMMFAVPIFYVASNRNKPEVKDYDILKDEAVFIDFALLTFKIFVFIVALQMTGFYDNFNKGFCRNSNGCNIRLKNSQKIC